MTNTFFEKYKTDVIKSLTTEFGIKNPMAVPTIEKIVVNMGTGETLRNKDQAEKLISELSMITGQKPKITKAKMSIAGFNLREGMPVGLTVTLRGTKMYDFLQKLITIVFPRLRDFRGVPTKSFDQNGNYTIGIVEHTVFPEIDLAKVDKPKGMEITIVMNSGSKDVSLKLLQGLGMPFAK